ncbi:putative nucleoporin FG repeat protein, partial [Toxoplasma gondii VEG]
SSSSSTSSLFGAPSSSSSSPFGVSSSSSTSSLFGAPSSSSSSPFGVSSSSLFGSSSSPFGTAGGTAPAAALEGGQGAKSEGTKFIDAWKNLEAAAKGGIWPFSSFGVAEAECLFVGLDISPEEHRYLFYQRPQSEWRALGEQIVATQLQHLRQFHALVGEKAAADRLSFEAAPPSVEFLHLALGGSLPQTSFSVPQETLQTPSLGALGAPPAMNKAEINREVSNLESLGTPGTRRDETDARGAAFAAPQFEPGKIPDVPPPRELC